MSTTNAKTTWNNASREQRQQLAENAGITYPSTDSWAFIPSWDRKKLCFSIEGCGVAEEDRHNEDHAATYCPEDNKIRIYIDTADGRVSRETFNFLRYAKYKSTPKQDCQFVATWSLKAEDAALALIPEWADIEDEDTSPQERAHERAQRFSVYRDKRRAEANGLADTYEHAPSAYGSQDPRRAETTSQKTGPHRRKCCYPVGKSGILATTHGGSHQ